MDSEKVSSLANAAEKLRQQGDLQNAVKIYERLLSAKPGDPQIIALYCDVLIEGRQAGAALNCIEGTLNAEQIRNSPEVGTAKAKALLGLGRWPEALAGFNSVVKHHSEWADGWNNLGCYLLELKRIDEAIPKLIKALALEPAHCKATLALAKAYKKRGEIKKSLSTLEHSLNSNENKNVRLALIQGLTEHGEYDKALKESTELCNAKEVDINDEMAKAMAYLNTDNIDGYLEIVGRSPNINWGGTSNESKSIYMLFQTDRKVEARHRLKEWLEKFPSDSDARVICAQDLLSNGKFKQGWREYEHRMRLPNNQLHYDVMANWDGRAVNGENVLVIGEQGVGDMCYFSRFLHAIIRDNPKTTLICEKRMVDLFETSYRDINIIESPDQITLLEKPLVKIAIGSLPLIYGSTEKEIDTLSTPIRARKADECMWHSVLDRDSSHKVRLGISLEAGRINDIIGRRNRSVPAKLVLEQLKGLPITLVDLQNKGHPSIFYQEAEKLELEVLHYTKLTKDLCQLAAMASALDGIITAQQTNAHLFGAMCKKGIVILPITSHFAFGNDINSIWYPTLRLIRASRWRDWTCITSGLRRVVEENWLD